MNIKNLKKILFLKEDIELAIEKYNNFIDELEANFYINSFEELALNSKNGNKILYNTYNRLLYIGLNKILWCTGNIDYYEVYYNVRNHSITYTKFKKK